MEKMRLITSWTWSPQSLHLKLEDILGGDMSPDVRMMLRRQEPNPIDQDSSTWRLAEKLANLVVGLLLEPRTEDLGFTEPIEVHISGINSIRLEPPEMLVLSYDVEFSNDTQMKRSQPWNFQELPNLSELLALAVEPDLDHTLPWLNRNRGLLKSERRFSRLPVAKLSRQTT